MILRTLALIALAAWLPATAKAEWARLKDGSIVKVLDRHQGDVAIKRADGSRGKIVADEIEGLLQAPAAARIVDDVLDKIGKPEHHDFVRTKLKQIGMAAVPPLLFHLRSPDLNKRRASLAALQMAWSNEAEQAVKELLQDDDPYLRRMALHLVQRHFPAQDRLRALTPLVESSDDPQLAGTALATMLESSPDAGRFLTALETRDLWAFLHPLLPRYQGNDFIPWSRRLLREGTTDQQVNALIALIYQMDDDSETRTLAAERLAEQSAEIRELSAEYLRWHGTTSEIDALELQAGREQDPYTLASIRAAVDAILNRASSFTDKDGSLAIPWPEDLEDAYAQAVDKLRESTDTATREAILTLLTKETFAPVYEYTEHWRLRPEPKHRHRLDLVNLAFGYPCSREREARKAAAFAGNAGEPPVPVATTLMPPIRGYFDPKRQSFGLLVPPGNSPFSDSHHVGDDVAFGRQQATIVAIGDGLVRIAAPGQASWGGLVVIEHRDAAGASYCSLYAHLGPLIAVQPGDQVRRGMKLGTLGRDHVFATGGYRSHLHFGIHNGDFENNGQEWIGGYLSPERYNDETMHRWLDPQPFLQSRMGNSE